MTAQGEDLSQLYIIDYGIGKFFKVNNRHLEMKVGKNFIGTTRYASIAAHDGNEIGRKDDLESLFYVLIYLYKKKLPWQNVKVKDEDNDAKED